MSQFLFKSSASSSGLEATNGQKATIAENLSREGEDFLVTNSGKCGVNTAENTGRRKIHREEKLEDRQLALDGRPPSLLACHHCAVCTAPPIQCSGVAYCNALQNVV